MDCKTIERIIKPYLENDAANVLSDDVKRHLQSSAVCQDKYAHFLNSEIRLI